MPLIPYQALSSWLFGTAVAHDISLALWLLASSLFMTAGSSLTYFKSLAMLFKECVSKFFETGEYSGKYSKFFALSSFYMFKSSSDFAQICTGNGINVTTLYLVLSVTLVCLATDIKKISFSEENQRRLQFGSDI